MNAFQLILFVLYLAVLNYDQWNPQLLIGAMRTLTGFVVGLIFGDWQTGLAIGATMEILAMGGGSYGGASVADYNTGTAIGTAMAISSGSSLEVGLTIALPVSLLMIQLDVLVKLANSFFTRRADACRDQLNVRGMTFWVLLAFSVRLLDVAILPALVLIVGNDFVNSLLALAPAWLLNGLTLAGGMLPAVGLSILLKFMNVTNYLPFLILGFVLAAYLKLGTLAIALIGLVAAMIVYRQNGASAGKALETSEGAGQDEF